MPKIFPPLIAAIIAVCMWLLQRYLPVMELMPVEWRGVGLLFVAIALVIDLWSLFLFIRARTTFHPLKLDDTSSLVTSGMYRFTRNPMYLGLLLLLTGVAIWLGGLTPFLMLPLFVWIISNHQIIHEERILEEKFEQHYLEYKQKVRRWL
ncbi:MAG: isoprenylcysteine carboxylmethyltransferase family protein [Gammaproteobacteria bacterium]|nr:isoprenylcysteine carboxylmethyltransferase family protein [Gammaproteobacteria bacterium]